MKLRSEAQLDALVGESKLPVLVKYFATWCRPCTALAPRFEALAKELDNKAVCVVVDVDELCEAAVKHGVQSVPTILLFSEGRLAARLVGSKSEEQLREWVQPFLAKPE